MLSPNQKVFVILWWPYKYQRQKVVFPVLVPLERRCCWSLHLRNLSLIQRIPQTSGSHSCCLRHAELPCGSWDRLSLVQLNDGIYTTNLCIHYSPSGNFCLSLAGMGISVDICEVCTLYTIYSIYFQLISSEAGRKSVVLSTWLDAGLKAECGPYWNLRAQAWWIC